MTESREAIARLLAAWRDLRAAQRKQKAWRLVARAIELHPGLMPEILDMAVRSIVTPGEER